ncbi:unnamed protein product [Peronospora farinosa]|uniref:Uncharacterized protein n=1 Tax=Peronospora farinosa TaxID=134698 RepID=A0ABN8BVN5_9STRA|nr:unnamed protein product [Peronospora farinosa]
MDAILSRVGISDDELRQHCVTTVLEELQHTNKHVQDVVSSLKKVLQVVQASRELQKSLVLSSLDQVQTSFRQLGESCNEIGPLLRLLYRNSSAIASTALEQPVTCNTNGTAQPKTKLAVANPSSTSASEYAPSSDEEDDTEPEVIEVEPPEKRKKRKAATLDLSASPTPVGKRKTVEEDSQTLQKMLTEKLQSIQAIPVADYMIFTHEEMTSLVKKVFAVAKFDDGWKPKDDPTLARLLSEMEKRIHRFKNSIAQDRRLKEINRWLEEMTAFSFVPTLDLSSIPPKITAVVSLIGSRNQISTSLTETAISARKILQAVKKDTLNVHEKRKLYFQPLLDAAAMYFFAVITQPAKLADNDMQANSLCVLAELSGGRVSTLKECLQLEALLYSFRMKMYHNPTMHRKSAVR